MTDRHPPRPLVELTLMRLREFVREPEAVFWVIIFPLVLAAALGVAFRHTGDEPVRVGIVQGPGSEATQAALAAAPGLAVEPVAPAAVDRALRDGRIHVVVTAGTPPTYRFDPTRPESRLARLVADEALQRAAGRADRFAGRDAPLDVIGARYIDWLVPGLVGMNIMGTSMWGIGFSIVWARTRKLLKRLAATPMSRVDYLLAQLLARLVFLVAEVGLLVVFAWAVFDVPVRGSVAALSLASLLAALAFGGLGLLVASRATTIEAASGWMNFVMLPMWVVSGVFFSSAHFPAVVQPFIHALPLTAVNDALRAIMLDGASMAAVSGELAILAGWGLGSFFLALRFFRWQ
jgi:ABC-type multidrug transport system permease subunit